MNIISGSYDTKQQKFISEEFELELKIKSNISTAGVMDAKIGIRPEKMTIVAFQTNHVITGEIIGVENLGAFTIIDVTSHSKIFKIRMRGQESFQLGQEIFLDIPPNQIHLFDADDLAIAHPITE